MDKNGVGDTFKKIFLAGIGTLAYTTEKSKDIVDMMVTKGQLTVEQGKILNEELRNTIRNRSNGESEAAAAPETVKEDNIGEFLKGLTPEQLDLLKEQISKMEQEKAAEETTAQADGE